MDANIQKLRKRYRIPEVFESRFLGRVDEVNWIGDQPEKRSGFRCQKAEGISKWQRFTNRIGQPDGLTKDDIFSSTLQQSKVGGNNVMGCKTVGKRTNSDATVRDVVRRKQKIVLTCRKARHTLTKTGMWRSKGQNRTTQRGGSTRARRKRMPRDQRIDVSVSIRRVSKVVEGEDKTTEAATRARSKSREESTNWTEVETRSSNEVQPENSG